MSKGLEELKEIELKWQYGVFTFIPNFEIIEKELKALEIIKNSVVATPNIPIIKTPAGEFVKITLAVAKEEYDFLKEVLL